MQLPGLRITAIMALPLLAATASSAAEPAAPQAEAIISPDRISRADATRIAQAALAECAKQGMPGSVVVVDAEGFQRVAFSDDNAKFIGLSTSSKKAAAVLAFKVSTRALQERVAADKVFAAQYGKDDRYHFSAGALPIYRNGKFVAVIAVGGARNIDEACASAGLKTLSWATTEPAAKPAP